MTDDFTEQYNGMQKQNDSGKKCFIFQINV